MFIHNFKKLEHKERIFFIVLISTAILIRIPAIIIYGDTSLDNEWKHLVNNLILHGQLVYESFDGYLLPNLWMPPLYAYYLYIFSFLGLEEQNYLILILSSQILLATLSVIVFYNINKNFFSKNISFVNSLVFSILPIHIYACTQISSITLQVFLLILFFYLFFKISNKEKNSLIFLLSIVSGLILLLRGEFQAIFILSLFYLFIFFKVSIKKILLIILITSITISPYLIRNFLIFEKITLVETFGYNLWKGNHPNALKNSLVEGSEVFDENLKKKSAKIIDGFIILEGIPRDINYRFNFNKFFLDQAIKNIKKDPAGYLKLYFRKITSFILIDIKSSDPNYYKPIHYVPVLLIGIISILGIIVSNKKSKKLNYLILIFFATVFIFSMVSILPRYKLIILPLQIIFSSIFIEYIKKKIYKN